MNTAAVATLHSIQVGAREGSTRSTGPKGSLRERLITSDSTSATTTKAMNVVSRFFNSPFIRFLGCVALGIGVILAIHFGAIHLTSSLAATKGIESAIGITVFGGAIVKYRKEVVFELTLYHTMRTMKHWYNDVPPPEFAAQPARSTRGDTHDRGAGPTITTPEHKVDVVLGAIPLVSKGHIDDLKGMGVTDVFSLNNLFELETKTVIAEPVTPKMWNKERMAFHNVPCTDFLPLTDGEIDSALTKLDIIESTPLLNDDGTSIRNTDGTEKKRKVYIHCKAGRGRSATVLACHFLKKHQAQYRELLLNANHDGKKFNPIKAVVAHIKEKRPDININAAQEAAITRYWNRHCLGGNAASYIEESKITPGCRDALVRKLL